MILDWWNELLFLHWTMSVFGTEHDLCCTFLIERFDWSAVIDCWQGGEKDVKKHSLLLLKTKKRWDVLTIEMHLFMSVSSHPELLSCINISARLGLDTSILTTMMTSSRTHLWLYTGATGHHLCINHLADFPDCFNLHSVLYALKRVTSSSAFSVILQAARLIYT